MGCTSNNAGQAATTFCSGLSALSRLELEACSIGLSPIDSLLHSMLRHPRYQEDIMPLHHPWKLLCLAAPTSCIHSKEQTTPKKRLLPHPFPKRISTKQMGALSKKVWELSNCTIEDLWGSWEAGKLVNRPVAKLTRQMQAASYY